VQRYYKILDYANFCAKKCEISLHSVLNKEGCHCGQPSLESMINGD